ncbi:MAG TPA: hypothetical protein VJL29_07435 [Thermoguttaceae bacterium]|nr:hypothetical protein [Thermoguttaceae bacterium]
MKPVAYLLATLLGGLGLLFVTGNQGSSMRIVVGVVLFIAAGALAWLAMHRVPESTTTVVQKIDLSGNVNLQDLTCRSCGGSLSQKSIAVRAGGIFVTCEFCGAAYQIEEDPKW